MQYRHSKPGRKLLRRSLAVEALESRLVLASYFVDSSATAGGDGTPERPFVTIGAAVAAARASVGPDDVQIAAGTYNENLYISDRDGLTLRGSVTGPTVIVGSLPINVILPTSAFAFENLMIQSTGSIGFHVDTANRPNVRDGSVSLTNVQIRMPTGLAIVAPELKNLSLANVSTSGGRVHLEDVDTASINNLSIFNSSTAGLVARWVTQLDVTGLTVTNPGQQGVYLENTFRAAGVGTPPVNVPATANFANVAITAAKAQGVSATGDLTLDVSQATVTGSTYDGFSLSNVTRSTLSNVQVTENQNGIFVSREGTLKATNVVAERNRRSGLYAIYSGGVEVVGGSFSENSFGGLEIPSSQGPINVELAQINRNGTVGLSASEASATVNVSNVTANANANLGISVTGNRQLAADARPDVFVTGSIAEANGSRGVGISSAKNVRVTNTVARNNRSVGLSVSDARGNVELSNSTFSGNSSDTTETVHGALLQNVQGSVSVQNVTANGNEGDGINVSYPTGNVTVDKMFASNNGYSGLAVINQPQSPVLLGISNSTLSSNMRNGLYAYGQRGIQVGQSHFDYNGPADGSSITYANGLWAIATGVGNILVEDSTAIGTRIGTSSGAGLSFANLAGASVTVRRATVSNTQIHPQTTTPYGAGIVNTGSSPGLLVEDSTLTGNRLTDSIHARSVIYSTNPLSVVNTQLLDNDGTGIDGLASVEVRGTTVARGLGGVAIKMGSGSIVGSTLSGHQQVGVWSIGALSIANSTITQNAGSTVVDNDGSVTIHNSIIAGNAAGVPLFASPETVVSSGYNLLGAMPAEWSGQASDIVGSSQQPIDPVLGPLANNGGSTLTHMPLAGSLALEAGDPQLNGTLDQRGRLRPVNALGYAVALPDIGSVEGDVVNVAPTVSLNATSVSGTEGNALSLSGSVFDVDANIVSLVSDRGTINLAADGTFLWSLVPGDNGSFTVTLTATDSFGATGTAQFLVQVSNAQPTVQLLDLQVNPATRAATLRLNVSDPGTEDSHTVTVDWGDGAALTYPVDANGQVEATHAYAMPGNVVITFSATDDDQATSDVQTSPTRISGVGLRSGQLVVFGTSGDDVVKFIKRGSDYYDLDARFAATPYKATFAVSSIDSVLAQLGNGNDQWQGGALTEPQSIFGEGGDDGMATGAGNDIAVGGDGADTINTGAGNDMVFGGYGRDVLRGGSGDDVLVAGRYQREDDLRALRILRSVWIGSGSYQSKVDRLRAGAGTDSDGVLVRLAIDTILDTDADQLYGESGRDWFLSSGTGDSSDRSKNESRN